MADAYFIEQRIESKDFTKNPLEKGEYEACHFISCAFFGSDLSFINFIECVFENCDLSNCNISGAAFREVQFKNCKMIGLNFRSSNELMFSIAPINCQLDQSVFFQRAIRKTHFINCSLKSVDFGEADLSEAVFEQCDLERAIFENTNAGKADFRTAFNYSINPEMNNIKKAKFSREGLAGLLVKWDIEIE